MGFYQRSIHFYNTDVGKAESWSPPSSCLSLVQNLESGGAVVVEKCAVPLRNGKLAEANLELRRAAGEGEY